MLSYIFKDCSCVLTKYSTCYIQNYFSDTFSLIDLTDSRIRSHNFFLCILTTEPNEGTYTVYTCLLLCNNLNGKKFEKKEYMYMYN